MNTNVNSQLQRSREHGMVLLYVAIVAMVLIGMAGLVVDGALVSSTDQQLQNAADGAALNAVRWLESETDPAYPAARAAAMSVAVANEADNLSIKLDANSGNSANGDIVVGHWDSTSNSFTPTVASPNAVRVRAVRTSANVDGPVSLLFGPLFGNTTANVSATSTAVLMPPMAPLVLILDPTANAALRINGTNALDVMAGKIQVNSNANCGLSVVGTASLTAGLTRIVGGACYPEGAILGPVQENSEYISDPLANVLPTAAAWTAFKAGLPTPLGANGKIEAGGTYDPGYYPKGLSVTSSGVIHLNPGSYMFGTAVKLGGSAVVYGDGVTLFMDKGVDLDVAGDDAGMQLTPPGEGSPFMGITFFTHRQTTGPSVIKIGGGGLFKVEGVMYVPAGEMVLGGTPGKEIGAILALTAKTDGVTEYTITGKGVPTLTEDDPSTYLVE